ncbi:DNA-binding protein [Salmonella enterica subsp. enterica serovar Braenderup]|nr:DNA-binding protein [Vibrio cholerae]EJI8300416.1 DNA-binding protein [Salmonella enterica subsp. enterica serovar Braenderup]EJI8302444.1 DNA-binding protein [Salmonella enterica subsp. enterica serovar Braenderup]EJI8302485.1 DNA-binding protein [Salmonella enterica subsp. enterica serovar Braenderup]EJZ9955700.1 DNA-binding protein [Salmonella enterica subsp. enterica serovar Braenderup]
MQQTIQIESDTGHRHLQLLSVHEVTALLKISAPTLQRIRTNDPTFPRPYRLAGERTLRYRIDQLESWLASRLVESDEAC